MQGAVIQAFYPRGRPQANAPGRRRRTPRCAAPALRPHRPAGGGGLKNARIFTPSEETVVTSRYPRRTPGIPRGLSPQSPIGRELSRAGSDHSRNMPVMVFCRALKETRPHQACASVASGTAACVYLGRRMHAHRPVIILSTVHCSPWRTGLRRRRRSTWRARLVPGQRNGLDSRALRSQRKSQACGSKTRPTFRCLREHPCH